MGACATRKSPARFLFRRSHQIRIARGGASGFKEKEALRFFFAIFVRQERKKKPSGSWMCRAIYYALCPYASRVFPFEVWILHRRPQSFIRTAQGWFRTAKQLAALLRARGFSLRRLEKVSLAYHLVVHTGPEHPQQKRRTSRLLEDAGRRTFTGISKILPIVGNQEQVLQHQGKPIFKLPCCRSRRPEQTARHRSKFMKYTKWRDDRRRNSFPP